MRSRQLSELVRASCLLVGTSIWSPAVTAVPIAVRGSTTVLLADGGAPQATIVPNLLQSRRAHFNPPSVLSGAPLSDAFVGAGGPEGF